MFEPQPEATGAPAAHALSSSASSAMTGRCHVIIVGAGIGGLTAALSLQRHGLKVSIHEQAAALGEVGAGLVLTPNAMHALNYLGVGEMIANNSNVSAELEVRHYRSGDVLLRRPSGEACRAKYGAGHFQVHRADLHGALSAAVLANDPRCIHLGRAFIDLTQTEGGVTVRFSDESVVAGDALIGCDGGRSTVRDEMYGSAPAPYSGQVSFRALVPAAKLPPELSADRRCFYIGPGRVFVHFSLRKNSVVNIVANARQSRWEDEGWTIPAEVSELRELYADFHPSVLQLIDAIGSDALFKWGLRVREPLAQWTCGRVSMLGDAAHPMLPFLGQGAVMAIEDGMVLGRCFAAAASPQEALRLYESVRKYRANAVHVHSRERARAMQGWDSGRVDPGRDAEDIGMFAYDPTTVPIGRALARAE
jgi:salicylate hydroxylase